MANETILEGGGVTAGFRVTASTRIDGFAIRDCRGITCYGSPVIANNTITGCGNAGEGGNHCLAYSPLIIGNTITGNNGGGINCSDSSCSPTILDNTISGNNGTGIYSQGGSPVIEGNTITDNVGGNYGGGIYCSGGSPRIANNTITGNVAMPEAESPATTTAMPPL